MQRSAKPFLILFGALVTLLLAGGVALALAVHQGGMIEVDIQSKGPGGCDIHGLRVPGCLAGLALHFIPRAELELRSHDLERARLVGPKLRRVMEVLAAIPDGVLIEVVGRDEHVRIAKEGRHLDVTADTEDETVHVRVPIRLASQVLEKAMRG